VRSRTLDGSKVAIGFGEAGEGETAASGEDPGLGEGSAAALPVVAVASRSVVAAMASATTRDRGWRPVRIMGPP
jgi:hypothetical protein